MRLTEDQITNARFRKFLQSLGFTDEGWIDHSGKFWPCDEHMLHGFIAQCVLGGKEDDAEAKADKLGWIRLSDYGNRTAAKTINQKQRNTLFDWCEYHELDFDEVVEGIKML